MRNILNAKVSKTWSDEALVPSQVYGENAY